MSHFMIGFNLTSYLFSWPVIFSPSSYIFSLKQKGSFTIGHDENYSSWIDLSRGTSNLVFWIYLTRKNNFRAKIKSV